MASRQHPQALGDVLGGVIRKMGIAKKLDEASAIEAWAALAGPRINGITASVWMKGSTLYVKITSAAWRHALHMQRRQWTDRLNAELGRRVVTEIVFR